VRTWPRLWDYAASRGWLSGRIMLAIDVEQREVKFCFASPAGARLYVTEDRHGTWYLSIGDAQYALTGKASPAALTRMRIRPGQTGAINMLAPKAWRKMQ
jgi:hypothetical protein